MEIFALTDKANVRVFDNRSKCNAVDLLCALGFTESDARVLANNPVISSFTFPIKDSVDYVVLRQDIMNFFRELYRLSFVTREQVLHLQKEHKKHVDK